MALALRRRSLGRILILVACVTGFRFIFSSSSSSATSAVSNFYSGDPQEIQKQGVLDLVTRGEKALDARKYKFLQARIGRDEREDLFSDVVNNGILDFWERFQKPL